MLNEPIAAHPVELLILLACLLAFVFIMKTKNAKRGGSKVIRSQRVVSSRSVPVSAAGVSAETVAVIMAALEAYGGGVTRITAIRPLAAWTRVGRMAVLEQRNKNFS